jgi:hypothetical protein
MASNLHFIKQVEGTTVADFNMTDIFTSEFETYQIMIAKWDTANDDYTYGRIINASGVDTGSNYAYAVQILYSDQAFYNDGKSNSSTTMSYLNYCYPAGNENNGGLVLTVYNPNSSSSYTYFTFQSVTFGNIANRLYGMKGIYVHKVAETVTGLQLGRTGNFDHIVADIYGVK